jgi:phosphoribosylglycinamide formyltransferase-1
MLIVSPEMCESHRLINLHPALPDGPTGAWEKVIGELIRTRAERTGAMMHLVTRELDRGPVVAYHAFSIKGKAFDSLWKDDLSERGPLFRRIRDEGVRREVPLIVLTLKALADGSIIIDGERICDDRGRTVTEGADLTDQVEAYVRNGL